MKSKLIAFAIGLVLPLLAAGQSFAALAAPVATVQCSGTGTATINGATVSVPITMACIAGTPGVAGAKGANGATGAAGASGSSPSAASVEAALAGDKTFVAAVAAQIAPTSSASTPPPAAAQLTGPSAPAGSPSSIKDAAGNVWTVAAGAVEEGGQPAGVSSGVVLLVEDATGVFWQENAQCLWWPWTAGAWSGNGSTGPSGVTLPVCTPPTTGGGTTGGGTTTAPPLGGGTPVTPPTGPLAVSVSAGRLVDGNGNTLQLRGANMSGLEFVAVQGQDVASWGGTLPAWATYATWKGSNAVRIPLNVASWLGLATRTADVQGATAFGAAVNPDPQGNYRQTVIAAVQAAQAIGEYVILDLHWSAPQATLGGVTAYITPDGQPEFMNATTDIAFWTDIAKTFGTQATLAGVNTNGVLFELFNEPYIDYYASDAELYGCMLNGCNQATFHWAIGAYSVSPTGGVQIAGYQQALNAIRATGAQNVLIVNGPSWAQESGGFKNWMPTDTLSVPQLAAGWHPYPSGTYPYSDGNVYGAIGLDPGANTAQFDQSIKAEQAAGYPIIITEDGGEGGVGATSGEPHMSYMMKWADTNGASYVAWEWTEPQAPGATTQNYMTTQSASGPLPIQGEGQVFHDWLGVH